jgi:very-short-patch-repair endonuclease
MTGRWKCLFWANLMKNDARLKAAARELRQNMTPAEKILWAALRGRRFAGFMFRRQQVVGAYILDFYCSSTMLTIEVDGETHLGKEQPDRSRTDWLEQRGIKVPRFWNTQIYDELEAVLELIFRECDERMDLRFAKAKRGGP